MMTIRFSSSDPEASRSVFAHPQLPSPRRAFKTVRARAILRVFVLAAGVLAAAAGAHADIITMTAQEAIGQDWDTAGIWSDGQSATASSAANPTNVYQVLGGARLRSPAAQDSAFPGAALVVEGDSVFVNGGTPTTGEIRFKQSADMGTVTFPNLVMNGGQLDTGNNGMVVIQGKMTIARDSTLYNDNTTGDRGYQIDAELTGTGMISFYQNATLNFNPAFTRDLNITGTSNTFSGKWNIVVGALVGGAPGCLGTNDIMIGVQGAFEPLYDVSNATGSLLLNGQMFLHQDCTFATVLVNGRALTKGKHTFAELSTAYPTNFPASWTSVVGSTFASGAGSVTVLTQPAGVTIGTLTPADGSTTALPDTVVAVELVDGAASTVVTNTIALTLDGTAVTPATTKSGNTTLVSFAPPSVFVPSSLHSAKITAGDSAGNSTNRTWSFTIMNGGVLLPGFMVSGVDRSKPGFLARPYETDATQPNSVAWTEEQLLGLHGPNLADLSGADANGFYLVATVVNWDKAGDTGTDGRFNSPDYPDAVMPGFPGSGPTGFDNAAEEVLTFVEFPKAGSYLMAVNSDDDFKLSSGKAPKDAFAVTLGAYDMAGGRAAADSTFAVVVPAAGAYPFRLLWENGTGGASVEWFTIQSGGTRALVNDTTNTVKAWQAATALPVYVSQATPGVGATGVKANASIVVEITDGTSTQLDPASVKVAVNSTSKTSSLNKAGAVTTVTAPSTGLLLPGTNTATLVYSDNASPALTTTNTWSFVVAPYDATPAGVVLAAGVTGAPWVNVVFNQAVDPATATNVANYKLVSGPAIGTAGVTNAILTSNGRTVILGVTGLTAPRPSLVINGVQDAAGRTITNLTTPVAMNALAVNFQLNTAPVPDGYLMDDGSVYGDRGNGFTYGWDADSTAVARYRNNAGSYDIRYDTFVHSMKPLPSGRSWTIAVTNGNYLVYLVAGESDNFDEVLKVMVQDVLVVDAKPTTAVRWADGVGLVTVTNGSLTVTNFTEAASLAEGQQFNRAWNNKFTFISIYPGQASTNITLAKQMPGGNDWNTSGYWSDGNGAAVSAATGPFNTYELLGGSRLRSPNNATNATFPGRLLTLDGSGSYTNNPGTNVPISEIRFKNADLGVVNFPHLVLNGGQLDTGNNGTVIIGGRVTVAADSVLYNDNTADRGYRIDAYLDGAGMISFYQNATLMLTNYVHGLNIAGTANKFTGKWNIVAGSLLGSGDRSLGSGDLLIGAQGALETLYNLNSTNAHLALDGRMYLHQDDTFKSATIAGNPLPVGKHPITELASLYPANFPTNWAALVGSTVTNASGSITVLSVEALPPRFSSPVLQGGNVVITWTGGGVLQSADKVTGPWADVATATNPYSVPANSATQKFYRVR